MSNYIEIHGLTKSFADGRGHQKEVLRGIDLSIRKGEIYGVIGFSGAGKSTLARCINRLEEPTGGSVVVDGVDVRGLSKSQLRQERRKVAMIFQNFNLFDAKDVYHNIAFSLATAKVPRDQIDSRVREAAELVGLTDKLDEYPGALSGGQKQRVGIARAIVNKPSVLLSDEATSALDPQTTLQILDLLREINERTGLTILMISHELDAIRYLCDSVAVIEDGRIVEQGKVNEVFDHPRSRTARLFTNVYGKLQYGLGFQLGHNGQDGRQLAQGIPARSQDGDEYDIPLAAIA